MAMAQTTTIPVNVGLILDMDTMVGKKWLSCISMALSDFYASNGHYRTRLVLNPRDSKNDVVGAASAALDLLKNVQVKAIIGPSTSMQADFVIELGHKAQVPIISFSATSPPLSSPYFIRATHNDSSQVKAISAIVQAFGWKEVVPIYVDNEFGEGIIPFLTDALQEIYVIVPNRSTIPASATDDQLVAELKKLRTMKTRVFIVHMLSTLGSRLFIKAKELGMMTEGYVWIISDALINELHSINSSVIDSMQGAIGVKSNVPRTKKLEDFTIRWKRQFLLDNPTMFNTELGVFELGAYDAATALAIAVEKVGDNNLGFQKANRSIKNSTNLETFEVSSNGPMLLQALQNTKFRGLNGDFYLVERQLQSSVFQIINVIGDGGQGIGFWTAENGIVRELDIRNKNKNSISKANLGSIIWPGNRTCPPKGWEIPTNGKKLRIGVPVKSGFLKFVVVKRNPGTNTTNVTGYCIDIFNTVMEALPYTVPYEYVPFATDDGKSAGTYNDLVYQVYLGKYDAVAGDTTITASRSQYVDFTIPFAESEVSMVVPFKDNESKNAWVFLKPLTWELWVTSFCSFVFIGFVIWVLEHRLNQDFRGPPSHQIGTMFWFSFSTMVFAHKEKMVGNLSRFVVIIWVFVVLILSQSYTASLASMLTVQHLQPTVTDVNELINKGAYVGYQEGSFFLGLLKQMGFHENKLKPFSSAEECHELFSKGSGNGGFAAVFLETPWIKLFFSKYCSKYTMVGPTYKTAGLGFVFPKGSPLVPDVSRAVLHVTEGDKIIELERKWLGQETSCAGSTTSLSFNSLGLESFWGLFLIVGVTSGLALAIFMITFIHEHWDTIRCCDPNSSIWKTLVMFARAFDQKDLSSHIFLRREVRDRSCRIGMDRLGSPEASTLTNCSPTPSMFTLHASSNSNAPPSPLNFSPRPEQSCVFFGNQGTPSHEFGDPNSLEQTTQEISPAIELTSQITDTDSVMSYH
ncbi:unnamed protein product [Ilex paraguariensis]|uniref:Glutamate receptor n=1 Tax=Ilex paraguariensis TaxID=185542 RepID=A0ABC8T5L4_9AQUA